MDFSEIIGNEKIKEYLIEQINNKSFVHSYLFSGTESIGKFLIAKEFARKILCLENNNKNCTCSSCVKIKDNNHPDFFIINEEEQIIKIDEIRNLTNKIIEKPILSNKKVYIINQCHKMTKEAQNCLLKTLEEPPEFAILILITSNENLLLNTIKSRCMKINFEAISDDEMKKYCKNTLQYKNISDEIIKSFSGSIGKAIKYKDNEEIYSKIENIIEKLDTDDIIEILNEGKIIYNKDLVHEYLEYMITCLFIKAERNKKYLECIKLVNEAIKKLRLNVNLDMNLDIMLIKMWEEVNEKSYRS